ncbi:MAG: sulfatase-like hydrolase/transferase, partial [Acidobacteria bacterium]|nr:sulfatase-like hydrolase/transferase [Acidobacteriota bacterium]
IGDLLRGLEGQGITADNTLMVLTSDHGEEFLERGWIGHTRTLYEELLRVPLVMVGPKSLWGAGRMIAAPVSTVAIMPTILDGLGMDVGELEFHAASLMPLARGVGSDLEVQLLGEVDFEPMMEDNAVKTTFKKALITAEYKLIRDDHSGALELYNLTDDPHEKKNLVDQEPGRAAELSLLLTEMLDPLRRGTPSADDVQLDRQEIEDLRSLGYVGSGGEKETGRDKD